MTRRRVGLRVLLGAATVVGAAACDGREPVRGDTSRPAPSTLRVTIIGSPGDARLPALREALAHWNVEAARLALPVRLDSGTLITAPPPDDLISFGLTTGTGRLGVIGLRPADRWPLSLPNTVRNVAAHELGHVLGLAHNADSTTLMCGRPAPCRPAAFASERPHFFPLTPTDEQRLRQRSR